MKKFSLFIVVVLLILTFTGCGTNSGKSEKYATMLTSHTWYNNTVGSITYNSDGTWTTKSLYGGRTGYWTLNGDTLNESNKDGKEWSYSFIAGITDADVDSALENDTMIQETWKGQWYVSDHYLILGKEVYKASE